MASKSLGTLTLDLIAKVGGFTAGMTKAEKATEKFRKKAIADFKAAGKFIGTALVVGAAAAASSFVFLTKRSLESIDAQAKMAGRLKTSSESLAVLARAGDLAGVSMKQVETAARTLDVNLGKASLGIGAQADALAALKLSAEDLNKLPLDQKLLAVNKALKENVSETKRAAIAADLFGSRSQAAILQLDPATIEEAARQIEIFGLNISDIDAKKVEIANDSMSTLGLLADGVGAQLAVLAAGPLAAVGQGFLDAAEDAGGLGPRVATSVREAVVALSGLADTAKGVGVAFTISFNGAIGSIALFLSKVAGAEARLTEIGRNSATSRLAGEGVVNARIQKLRQEEGLLAAASIELLEKSKKALETPFVPDMLLRAYDAVQAKAQAAAEAAVAAAKAGALVPGGKTPEQIEAEEKAAAAAQKAADAAATAAQKAADALLKTFQSTEAGYAKQIALIKLTEGGTRDLTEAEKLRFEIASGNLVGINDIQQQRLLSLADELDAIEKVNAALEAQGAVNVEAASIVEGLKSQEQKLQESYDRQRDIILKSTEQTAKEKAEIITRLEQDLTDELSEINAGYWERYVAAMEENLTSLDEVTANTLNNLSQGVGSAFESMVFDAETFQEALFGLVDTIARSMVSAIGEMIAQWLVFQLIKNTTDTANKSLGASALIANAGATSAQAAIAAYASTAAIPVVGPGLAPAAALQALASTAPYVASVSSFALAGVAHDGLDAVPQTGTYLLEKGERVTTAETSAKLDRTLSDVQNNRSEGTSSPTNLRIVNAFDTAVIGDYIGSSSGEQLIMNTVKRNQRTIQSLSR